MYKLANIIDPVFQKVVSRQLLEVLNDFAGGRIDYLPDKITVENIVNCYYPQYIPYYGEEKVYDFFMKKIEKMIEELKDPENEYSFDIFNFIGNYVRKYNVPACFLEHGNDGRTAFVLCKSLAA